MLLKLKRWCRQKTCNHNWKEGLTNFYVRTGTQTTYHCRKCFKRKTCKRGEQ